MLSFIGFCFWGSLYYRKDFFFYFFEMGKRKPIVSIPSDNCQSRNFFFNVIYFLRKARKQEEGKDSNKALKGT